MRTGASRSFTLICNLSTAASIAVRSFAESMTPRLLRSGAAASTRLSRIDMANSSPWVLRSSGIKAIRTLDALACLG